jgi:hypothetical protein
MLNILCTNTQNPLFFFVCVCSYQSSAGGGKPKKSILSEQDPLWPVLRHKHISEAITYVLDSFNSCVQVPPFSRIFWAFNGHSMFVNIFSFPPLICCFVFFLFFFWGGLGFFWSDFVKHNRVAKLQAGGLNRLRDEGVGSLSEMSAAMKGMPEYRESMEKVCDWTEHALLLLLLLVQIVMSNLTFDFSLIHMDALSL